MGEKEVRSIIPVEETIIDPLYEPLKLNRYELCPHLKRLKDVSHLGYGFSPYLLFDVEEMKGVVGAIKEFSEIKDSNFENSHDKFMNSFNKYIPFLEQYFTWSKGKIESIEKDGKALKSRNEIYEGLRENKEVVLGKYSKAKAEYQKILRQFLYPAPSNEFNEENHKKIAHLFRLEYPVKVKCPLCKNEAETNPNIKPYMFMCEEGKIYSMKEALLRTFELRRARWLYMSGSLHTVHRASTHTRLSHEIGSMIVAVNALCEIDVYPYGDMSMSLGEYLLMRGKLYEFLIANFLHDLGHPPLSHVLEPNPFIELDHEKITGNLILGKRVEEEGMDWYVTERYLLRMKAIKDFEYRFLENRDDSIYDIGEELKEDERTDKFLDYLRDNNEILESEIVTVSEVLKNFGIDKKRVVEILSGKVFRNITCQNCGKKYKMLLKIEEDTEDLKCKFCKADVKKEDIERIKDIEKIPDTQFLNKLLDSEIDFDRMDHVKRDSMVCGLSLISFRLLELLASLSIVLPESHAHKQIHKGEENKPYIFISEDGLLYVMDLLTARRCVFRDILYSDENNWINGVVNQITALAVRYLPHLTNMLPFITDQILMHFYTNDLFLGTQIEKLNKLFHGKMDCSAYGKPMRCKLRDEEKISEEQLKLIYIKIEEINDGQDYRTMDMPAVVFYTNIKAKEEEKEDTSKEKTWDDMLLFGKKVEGKYYPFQKLVDMKYQGITRERFPERPSELDVKNLFYVWVNDFAITDEDTKTSSYKSKNEWRDEIKEKIEGVWTGDRMKEESEDDFKKRKIKEFGRRFVDLDIIER